ncbi:MAG: polyphenol oxidase family protein [Gemmatimonadaceae bacterium]|nr:polyphenol oxidase family protein [Gemmatimonadaceae bacterium]
MPSTDGPSTGEWAIAVEPVAELAPLGVTAFTTTRQAGSFGLASSEPVQEVMDRWTGLLAHCRRGGAEALASAGQVHGAAVAVHASGWHGWLRGRDLDGHGTAARGVALAVTVADCTPVFLAHPAGPVAMLHAGWRGTAAGILGEGLAVLRAQGAPSDEVLMHCGPAICGACYEVGPEVLEAVTGRPAQRKGYLDVRAVLAEQATRAGLRSVSISGWCTRCHNDRFFSHRAGDAGRQLGVIWRAG